MEFPEWFFFLFFYVLDGLLQLGEVIRSPLENRETLFDAEDLHPKIENELLLRHFGNDLINILAGLQDPRRKGRSSEIAGDSV
jgi:hypothetical protein